MKRIGYQSNKLVPVRFSIAANRCYTLKEEKMKKPFIWLGMVVLMFGGVVSANATAIACGDLTLTAGIIYDQNTLDVNYGLETWTVGEIYNTGKVVHDDSAMYGDQNIAGWDKEIDEISLSYLESKINIINDHLDPIKPTSESLVHISTVGYTDLQIQSSVQAMYFADFTAKDDRTFSFLVDHDGNWT